MGVNLFRYRMYLNGYSDDQQAGKSQLKAFRGEAHNQATTFILFIDTGNTKQAAVLQAKSH